MQYERQRHGTLLPCTPQIFSIKHASYTLFFLWGITAMHRCCGVYGLCSLRVAVAAPNSFPTFVCVSGFMCPHVLLQSVCGDGGATRARGPWRAECVSEPSAPTTLLLLFALSNTVLGGWHPLSVVVVVLVHVAFIEYCVDGFLVVGESLAVDDFLVLAASHFCA
ncbi:retrotransposon hot spot (RHS) protein [Trypanosoma cruzi]|nr:retrotransposon hot spot (RHS) protein [Trypanosoma cruzi]